MDRMRAPDQQGVRIGVNLPVGNLHGSQIAWKYQVCAGHAVHWIPDGVKRQAGK
jgi:hypothetical protein